MAGAARRIAFLTPTYFADESIVGGGERYPLNLALGLVAATEGAYRVEILSFGRAPARIELAPGVTMRLLPAAKTPREGLDFVSWDLPAAIAGADLVHIHQCYTRCAEVGLLAAKQQRKPVCLTDHGGYSSDLGRQYGLLELADLIVSFSEFGASLHRPTTTRSVVILGGVDTSAFTPPEETPARDRFLFVGRLLPHKGIDRLISALPADLPLTVCGRPYHADYYRRLTSLADGKRVEFVTDADDATLLDFYRRAWATILPSVHEDCYGNSYLAPELMGFTLLESMACGTPAIASRVGGMPEYIREGETGFLFDDEAELTDRLTRLATDVDLADRMGHKARRVVEAEYDLRVAGAALFAEYEVLFRGAQRAAS
jgi:glycosyltransferase involved in cell wall biosynthesis